MTITTIRYERRVNTHDYDNTTYAAEMEIGDEVTPAQAFDQLRAYVREVALRDLAQRWPDPQHYIYHVADPDLQPADDETSPAPAG